jgi:3-oxoacyl-[acyl-carrier-protein] synthase II
MKVRSVGLQASDRDVVITGMGVVSPLGLDLETVWQAVAAGQSGIKPSSLFPGIAAPNQAGGTVDEFTEEAARKVYLKEHRKNLKAMCREIQLGVAAAMLALKHSGLDLSKIDHTRLGVEFGANLMLSAPDILAASCVACEDPVTHDFLFDQWGSQGLPRMEPLWLLRYLPNMPACHISIVADARGPSNSLTLDDASANTVIGEAQRILLRNSADIMITGSTGTQFHPIKTLHMALWHDLATSPDDPAKRARPFDKNRSGRVVAEGAGCFILEDRGHAEARSAKIWGRILGTGGATITDRTGQPKFREAFAGAMRVALKNAGVAPEEIGHINAHGLGTKAIDLAEALAIHDVFGHDLGRRVPITAPKSLLGNSGAGSGSLELMVSLLGLQHGVVPPTINYDTPDPELPPLNIVTGHPRPAANKVVLNVNVSRIGQASASVVEAA